MFAVCLFHYAVNNTTTKQSLRRQLPNYSAATTLVAFLPNHWKKQAVWPPSLPLLLHSDLAVFSPRIQLGKGFESAQLP